jgi:hypothetical protein
MSRPDPKESKCVWRSFGGPDPKTLVLAMFAATAWIATHRYQGIWHDGVLYAGQAISRIDPAPFAKDLFFAYGSQDGFTAFTWIYALAIQKLGLPLASKLLLGLAHLAWFVAAAWLLRGVLRTPHCWLALVLVAALPGTYGAFGIFAYGESFLTARIWAEPAALLAVACILRGRRIAAVVSLAFAAAMHPVMAFPSALFLFIFGLRARHQLILALAGVATLALLVFLEVPPFANLTKTMDPQWLSLSVDRSPFVFVDHWSADEISESIFLAILVATAALGSTREGSRLWCSALGVFLAGMGLSLLVVYWPGVLLIQMQPWRVLWLTKILAVVAGMFLVQETWSISAYSRLLVGALVACALVAGGVGTVGAALLSALILARHRFALEVRLPLSLVPLVWGAIGLVVCGKIVSTVLLTSISLDVTASSISEVPLSNRLFSICKESGWFIFPPLMLGLWWLLQNRPTTRRWLLLLVGTCALLFGGHWQRTSTAQANEEYLQEAGHRELASIIQPDHLVYWGAGHHLLWLVLHRGSYASQQQAAGIVFSRRTALEANRRLARLARLGLPDSRFGWEDAPSDKAPELAANLDGLIHVCHDPLLDFVVLPQLVAGAIPSTSISLHPSAPKYHLYACALLRAVPDPFPSAS